MKFRAWMIAAAVCAVLGVVPAASAQGWLTYDQNGARAAQDVDTTNPWSPSLDWNSPDLDGLVYGQPLVDGSNVYVATENDTVYDLNLYTGAVVWSNHFATPVPSSQEPCGIIMPELGVTSTPVIDPSTNEMFVVGEQWDGTDSSSVQFDMYGFNLSNGSIANGPVNVTPSLPSGDIASAQLQRPGLALENGNIYVGFGGQGSACQVYHGYLEEVPENGTGPINTFAPDQPPLWGGSFWAGGNAPVIDPNGDIWATTADAEPGRNLSSSQWDYDDSVIQFDPSLNILGFWVPQNYLQLDKEDLEIGSSMPTQLPDGLWFQTGKQGMGYLLSTSSLSPAGTAPTSVGAPLWSGQVCPSPDGNWGGSMYYNGVIYVTCQQGGATKPGLIAYSLNTSTPSLTPVTGWYSNLGSITPPIEAGGLIWSTQWAHGNVYAVNPTTGRVVFSATLGTMPHFTGLSAGGGLVFVPHTDPSNTSNYQVTAYHINNTIVNGGFETGDFTGWTPTGQFKKILHASSCYAPVYCAQLGRTSATNGPSAISQTFTAPAGGSPTLSFYYDNVCTGTVANGYATATLVDSTAPRRKTITVLPDTCTNTGTWANVSQSLYPGDQYTLTLKNWDDNDPTYYSETFFDNVVVQ